jgi:hypothetical protein
MLYLFPMLGYILFSLAFLFYFLFIAFNVQKPSGAGDSMMGYGLAMGFLGLGFTIFSGCLIFRMAYKGGFDWAARQPLLSLLLLSGWLMLSATTFFCGIFRWEKPDLAVFPKMTHWGSQIGTDIWLPLLFFVPCFILLSDHLRTQVSPAFYTVPLKTVYVVSAVFCIALLQGWVRTEAAHAQNIQLEQTSRDEQLTQDHLKWIAEQTAKEPIINIIALTGRFTEPVVRTAALAKLNERPDLEGDLIDLLNNKDYYYHAYDYLDGNTVAHPERFVKPIQQSLVGLADIIEKSIQKSTDLREDNFEHLGVTRLLRAIDEQFSDHNAAFYSNLQAVLRAFDTPRPAGFEDVQFPSRSALAAWLEQHKGG